MKEKGKQPKRGGRPVRNSAGMTMEERRIAYSKNLSRVVGEACDRFFDRKGMPRAMSWKEQHKANKNEKV